MASRAVTWSQSGSGTAGEALPWANPTVTSGTNSQQPTAAKASNKEPSVPWYKWLTP